MIIKISQSSLMIIVKKNRLNNKYNILLNPKIKNKKVNGKPVQSNANTSLDTNGKPAALAVAVRRRGAAYLHLRLRLRLRRRRRCLLRRRRRLRRRCQRLPPRRHETPSLRFPQAGRVLCRQPRATRTTRTCKQGKRRGTCRLSPR